MSEPIPDNPVKGMTKKLGPLPLYAYAVIIVGVAYGVYWWKNNRVGVARPEGATTDVGSGFATGAQPFPSAGGYTGTVPQTGTAAPSSKTNAQWAKATADSLIASGGGNPADIMNAITAYLGGNALDEKASAIIATALRQYGSPPEGIVAVKQTATPVTPLSERFVKFLSYKNDPTLYGITRSGEQVGITYAQWAALGFPRYEKVDMESGNMGKTPATTYTLYTVKDGDTLGSIAQNFYGSSDGSNISTANPGVGIFAGNVLKVPVK